MLHFLMQAVNPINSLIGRLRDWRSWADQLRERPRRRQLQMDILFMECAPSDQVSADETKGGEILVAPEVQAHLDDEFIVSPHGSARLKGIEKPVHLFNVMGLKTGRFRSADT